MKSVIALFSLFLIVTVGCSSGNENNNLSFNLNELEQSIYDQRYNFDESMLLNVDPISIAKLYAYAMFHGDYDFVYDLYTQREGYVSWSKEEDKLIPKEDRGTREQLANTFNNIENGEFYQQNEDEGYIEFETGFELEPGIKSGFMLIKNSENDIWKVSFMPIQ